MPMTFDGNGTITGLAAGGLPNGTVQPADLSTGAPTWDTSGNVGIGTSSPGQKLDVVSTGSIASRVRSTSNDGTAAAYHVLGAAQGGGSNYFRAVIATSDNGVNYDWGVGNFGTSAKDVLAFYAGGLTERARIDSSGNLLVGTTNNLTNIGVAIQPNAISNNANININHPSGVNTNPYMQFVYSTGTVIGTITQNGTTAVAYNTTSDYRLKENVQPLTGALEKVSALKPCTYTWKSAPDETGEGFIAHELAEVCPQAVTGEKDAVDEDGNPKYQSIDTSFLVATLTAAIQELNAKVEAQAAEIAALKGQA